VDLNTIDTIAKRSIGSYYIKYILGSIAYSIIPKEDVALASFPRSGNTWLRLLLEDCTGLKTGSIYRNDGVHERSHRGVVIKTHSRDSFKYRKAIHLIRNPYDSIYSFYEFRNKYYKEENVTWEGHVRYSAKLLRNHWNHWSRSSCPTLLLKYEELKGNENESLRRVLNYLEFDISDQKIRMSIDNNNIEILKNQIPSSARNVIRKGIIGEGYRKFSNSEKDYINGVLKDFITRNYPSL